VFSALAGKIRRAINACLDLFAPLLCQDKSGIKEDYWVKELEYHSTKKSSQLEDFSSLSLKYL